MTLVSGKTCGKCRILERHMVGKFKYNKIYAENNMDLCRVKNIQVLPSLIADDGEVIKGLENCLKFIKTT